MSDRNVAVPGNHSMSIFPDDGILPSIPSDTDTADESALGGFDSDSGAVVDADTSPDSSGFLSSNDSAPLKHPQHDSGNSSGNSSSADTPAHEGVAREISAGHVSGGHTPCLPMRSFVSPAIDGGSLEISAPGGNFPPHKAAPMWPLASSTPHVVSGHEVLNSSVCEENDGEESMVSESAATSSDAPDMLEYLAAVAASQQPIPCSTSR